MVNAIISLSTIPSRLAHIEPCVESLIIQGLPIRVWIPRVTHRTGEVFDGHVPRFLQRDSINVEMVEDLGPITKLLPALDLAPIVITADDDVTYGEGWARGLLEGAEHLSGSIGYRGRILKTRSYNDSHLIRKADEPLKVDLITATWGRLCRSADLSDSIRDEVALCPWNDDIVIDAHLKAKGINRWLIPRRCRIHPIRDVQGIDALWDKNRKRNDRGLEAIGWWS